MGADGSTRITIEPLRPGTWIVRVDAEGTTEHAVTIPDGYLSGLGVTAPPEQVLRESFRFLLEREPAAAILGRFSLPVIEHYFPGYPEAMRAALGR